MWTKMKPWYISYHITSYHRIGTATMWTNMVCMYSTVQYDNARYERGVRTSVEWLLTQPGETHHACTHGLSIACYYY